MSFFSNFSIETTELHQADEASSFPWPWGVTPPAAPISAGRAQESLADELRAERDEARARAQRETRRADEAESAARVAERRLAELQRRQAALLPVTELFEVLDDIDRAKAHGDELSGVAKSVATGLQAVMRRAGFVAYGREGDTFDPAVHDAIDTRPGRQAGKVASVHRRGYARDGEVVRPAQVWVTAVV